MKVRVNGQVLKVSALVRENDGSISGFHKRKLIAMVSDPKDLEIIVNIREIGQN